MTGVILLLFTLFWSGIILTFDGLSARTIYRQYESGHYPSVTGTITHSEVKSHHTSKGGTSYEAVIAYHYNVGGRDFEGSKLRFAIAASGFDSATAAVSAHPAGSAATVYYDPADPRQAVLSPGVEGSDLFIPLFLTAFNMVMLGLWIVLGGWLREHFFRPAAGGVKIIADGMTTRIRLPQLPAVMWGLGTTGGLGFISMFAVAFGTNMNPSIPLVLCIAVAIYSAGLLVYLWQRQKIDSGIDDLIIDEPARTLELPLTFGRKERMTVNIAAIECLAVEMIAHRSKNGISYTFAPTLRLRGMEPATQKLADWSDKLKADDFTEWLRNQLGAAIPATYNAPQQDTDPAFAGGYGTGSSAALPPPVGEIRRDEHSRIRVSDGPDGREFYFPAARNPGAALFTTVLFLAFCAGLDGLTRIHAPLPFDFGLGFFTVILGVFAFTTWFRSTRVTVNSSGVTRVNRWLFFAQTRRFDAGEITGFATRDGMRSGSKVYQDIKLITRSDEPRLNARLAGCGQADGLSEMGSRLKALAGITLASSISHVGEANWLVQEMTKALGRSK
jgi:hypothetical protein